MLRYWLQLVGPRIPSWRLKLFEVRLNLLSRRRESNRYPLWSWRLVHNGGQRKLFRHWTHQLDARKDQLGVSAFFKFLWLSVEMLNLPGRGRLGWYLAFHRPNIRHCGRIWYSGCTTARHAEYSTADTNRGLNLCWSGAQRDKLKG